MATAPYGFARHEFTGQLLPVDIEQRVIAAAREYESRGFSLDGVVRALARDGHTNRAGKPHTRTSVSRMLGRVRTAASYG